MVRQLASCAIVLAGAIAATPARADGFICVGALTDIEVLFRVRLDPYFTRNPVAAKKLRVEYEGCGYRIHVGESSRNSGDGDLLLVDPYGRITKVVHRR